MAKALYISSQNTVDCYKSFCLVSKFLITNTTFFSSWNIGSIIPLVSITYLLLVYNYNTIRYIYFINSRQCAGMPSRLQRKHVWYLRSNFDHNPLFFNHLRLFLNSYFEILLIIFFIILIWMSRGCFFQDNCLTPCFFFKY